MSGTCTGDGNPAMPARPLACCVGSPARSVVALLRRCRERDELGGRPDVLALDVELRGVGVEPPPGPGIEQIVGDPDCTDRGRGRTRRGRRPSRQRRTRARGGSGPASRRPARRAAPRRWPPRSRSAPASARDHSPRADHSRRMVPWRRLAPRPGRPGAIATRSAAVAERRAGRSCHGVRWACSWP